jgi:rod shape-determining protein MreD
LRSLRHISLLLLGFVLLLLQENFFRATDAATAMLARFGVPEGYRAWPGLVPAFALPLILFMGVQEYSLVRGASIAFALGYATDLLGIAPVGLYTFTYVALFALARAAGLRLAAQTRWMQLLLTLAFVAIQSAIVLVLLSIFGLESWVPKSVFRMALPHALATALVGPVVFFISERVHALGENPRASKEAMP